MLVSRSVCKQSVFRVVAFSGANKVEFWGLQGEQDQMKCWDQTFLILVQCNPTPWILSKKVEKNNIRNMWSEKHLENKVAQVNFHQLYALKLARVAFKKMVHSYVIQNTWDPSLRPKSPALAAMVLSRDALEESRGFSGGIWWAHNLVGYMCINICVSQLKCKIGTKNWTTLQRFSGKMTTAKNNCLMKLLLKMQQLQDHDMILDRFLA